jgi:SAM-dependent methyltransferase
VRCCGCGLVSARADGAPLHLYEEHYYKGLVYSDYLADRPAIRRNAARALEELEALAPGRRLLDVGCAAGFFLEVARERGWTVEGVEVSDYAADQARRLGLKVFRGSLLELPDAEPRFDVVTMWDVIEHLERPDRALAKVRRMLEPGGVVAISTGDFASLARRLSGRHWRLFADPTHLFFFDRRTLDALLERSGFRIASLSNRGKWVGLSMLIKQLPLPLGARLRALLERWARDRFVYVNAGDVTTVLAISQEPGSGS